MHDKVSIVIPTYNSMKYIDETIQSCVSQTHQNIEIIIIDDCSADGTRRYLQTLDNVVYIENKQNEGISKNVNKGVKISTGKYVIILGHDDILPNFHIEKMLDSFDDDTGLVHCNSIKINPLGDIISLSRKTGVQVRKSKHALKELIKSNYIQSCGLMFRKETFLSFGGWDERYRLYGEWLSYVKFAACSKIEYNSKTFGFHLSTLMNLPF